MPRGLMTGREAGFGYGGLHAARSSAWNPGLYGDPDCIAVYRMEPGGVGQDSKGGYDLTVDDVTADETNLREGKASGYFARIAPAEMYRGNGALPNDWPFKAAGSPVDMTICGWLCVHSFTYMTPLGYFASLWADALNQNKQVWYLNVTGAGDFYLGAREAGGGLPEWQFNQVGTPLVVDRWYWFAATMENKSGPTELVLHLWLWDDVAKAWIKDDYNPLYAYWTMQNGGDFCLGALEGVCTGGHDGWLDEFVMFKRVLTDAQIHKIVAGKY